MGRATAMQTSLNGGEISSLMMGRLDQNVYSISGETMENFVPLIQGPMLKRSGIRHVAEAKGPCRLIEFEYNTTQAYLIEAGNLYARFYTNNARIEDGGGVPYEIALPYAYADVLELDYHASADVLYLVHGSHAPRTLSRSSAETFALATLELTGGPFDDDNQDEDIAVAATASTGDVTLYATGGDIFEAGHVGGLFRMECKDYGEIPSWEPGMTIEDDGLRTWEGKVYQKVGGTNRTGTIPPIHAEGVEWDGTGSGTDLAEQAAGGIQWLYLHDRYGILRITAFTSGSEVSATVLRRLPFGAAMANSYQAPGLDYTPPYTTSYSDGDIAFSSRFSREPDGSGGFTYEPVADDWTPPAELAPALYLTPGTWRWAFGAFSTARGWPEHVYIWNERLILTKGATGYASVVGAYTDFRERNEFGEIVADMAMRFTLNSPNPIRWVAGDERLLIGTAKNEHVGSAMGGTGVPGPGNFKAPAQTDFGSVAVKPIQVGGRVLHVEKSGRRLMMLDMSFERSDRFDSEDLTVMAHHVTTGGVRWMARQQAPHSLVWIGTDNGTLAAMAFSPKQEVRSWCRCPIAAGSLVEWGASIPDPDGRMDQLWLSVERDGTRLIGFMEEFWEPGVGSDVSDAFFVDHGLTYSGAAADRVTGLDHLIGETVGFLGDGQTWGTAIVDSSGGIDLPGSFATVHAGLAYTARFKSLRIEAGGDDGSGQGKIKRIVKLVVRLLETAGLRARVQDGDWDAIDPLVFAGTLDASTPLITVDWPIDTIGHYDRDGQCEFESDTPLPACILAITPTIVVGQR